MRRCWRLPRNSMNSSELTRDNPRQQSRIGPLKLHIDAKLAELKQTIDLRRTQGSEAALADRR